MRLHKEMMRSAQNINSPTIQLKALSYYQRISRALKLPQLLWSMSALGQKRTFTGSCLDVRFEAESGLTFGMYDASAYSQ